MTATVTQCRKQLANVVAARVKANRDESKRHEDEAIAYGYEALRWEKVARELSELPDDDARLQALAFAGIPPVDDDDVADMALISVDGLIAYLTERSEEERGEHDRRSEDMEGRR